MSIKRFKKIYSCELPFPPSVNSAYGGGSGQRRFKSKSYKEWERAAPELILPECGAIEFPVIVEYTLYFPDRRKRDLSNYIKIPEDYLVKHCVLVDDNHTIVEGIDINYGGLDKGKPRVEIEIYRPYQSGSG